MPVPAKHVEGDYDGDGVSDPAVYDDSTGDWFILKQVGDGRVLSWYQDWGFPGAVAVPGDYNGNLRNDLAVYCPESGEWWIRTLEGEELNWAMDWGYPSAVPVCPALRQ